MSRRTYGTWLVIGGVALLVVVLVGSVALAGPLGATGAADSPTLVGIHGGGFGLHEHGSVTLYDTLGRPTWSFDAADSYFDVTMLESGTVLAGFMNGSSEQCGPYESPCARTGFHVIGTDPAPHLRNRYSFPVRSKFNSEVHDVEALPSGNYLLTDMEYERIMVVTPEGERVWEWNASSRYSAPEDPTRVDWLHINDVDRIGEGRYLVSVRNANELLVVERGAGVVEVINEGGDPDLFFRQHNPQWLGPGAVLVADSGNDRIVELHYDESAGEWRVAWSLQSAEGVSFDWPRDADRLPNGNTLITDTVNRRIVEVTEAGETVWSTSTRWKPYEADRLPAGETVGGPTYENSSGASDRGREGGVPVLTEAYNALRVVAPLPYWFGQWHLLATVAGLVSIVAGGALRLTGDGRS
ncbi:MAG: arylsulfotransferase family protein [Halobacteriales archaeon]